MWWLARVKNILITFTTIRLWKKKLLPLNAILKYLICKLNFWKHIRFFKFSFVKRVKWMSCNFPSLLDLIPRFTSHETSWYMYLEKVYQHKHGTYWLIVISLFESVSLLVPGYIRSLKDNPQGPFPLSWIALFNIIMIKRKRILEIVTQPKAPLYWTSTRHFKY